MSDGLYPLENPPRTAADDLTAARRLIGEAMRKHAGADALDEPTRKMLAAVDLLDDARRSIAGGAR